MNDRIGALWEKSGRNGVFFAGEIELNGEKTKIVVFPNSKKEKETQPDWNILISKPLESKTEHINPEEIPF